MITSARTSMPTATALAAAIGELAHSWYDSVRPGNARLVRTLHRPHTLLHLFEIAPERMVVAKLSRSASAEIELHRQYEALLAAHGHFATLREERIAAIRPLAYLSSVPALITEFRPESSLRSLATRRWFADARRLEVAFRNCGAWLRAFHAMRAEAAPARRATREEFVASAEALSLQLRESPAVRDLLPWLRSAADACLPQALPLALKHGDYAMRNILVGDDGRTLALDIEGRWRSSPHEDVAYFLTQMRTARAQLLARPLAAGQEQLASCEQWFLEGYGFDSLDAKMLSLFRIRALLDRWATLASRASQRLHGSWIRRLQERHFAAQLQSLRQAVEA